MKWVNFLHFYQPANQQKDILEAVVNQCYRPLLGGLVTKKQAKLTINVSGSLIELLDRYGYTDVIDIIRQLYQSGHIELTSTACYHAFLPLLSENEIIRQVTLNNEIVRKYIGNSVEFAGFFPPEMGVNAKLLAVLNNLKYKYILVDGVAYKTDKKEYELPNNNSLHTYLDSKLLLFFRERIPSNIIMSGLERHSDKMIDLIGKYNDRTYLITAMDGETFGHHRPGLEKTFLEVFDNTDIQFSTCAELLSLSMSKDVVDINDSTWASSLDDIAKGIQFISWQDPSNILHTYQWEFVNLMLKVVNSMDAKDPNFPTVRAMTDRAVASDQFFWACAKPWWSVEMIEAGAYTCLEVIEKVPTAKGLDIERARTLYRTIISTAFDWQRTGKIREMSKERSIAQRIPFKTRTLEAGGLEPAVYNAFIDIMRQEEQKAGKAGEYEKAILWRDSVYKIETKNDIYDAINAIDLLRMDITNEKVEQVIDQYKKEYAKIRGGQPEQRSN